MLHVVTCECGIFGAAERAAQRAQMRRGLNELLAAVPEQTLQAASDTVGAWGEVRRPSGRVERADARDRAAGVVPEFTFQCVAAGQCAYDVEMQFEPAGLPDRTLTPWIALAIQRAAAMAAEQGAPVGARLRRSAAALGAVTVSHESFGWSAMAPDEGLPIRGVQVVYGQLGPRRDAASTARGKQAARAAAAGARMPDWMAAAVRAERTADGGRDGWVQRRRRVLNEREGAAQRHRWENVAVSPEGRAYAVTAARRRLRELTFVVEVETLDGERIAHLLTVEARQRWSGEEARCYERTPAAQATGEQLVTVVRTGEMGARYDRDTQTLRWYTGRRVQGVVTGFQRHAALDRAADVAAGGRGAARRGAALEAAVAAAAAAEAARHAVAVREAAVVEEARCLGARAGVRVAWGQRVVLAVYAGLQAEVMAEMALAAVAEVLACAVVDAAVGAALLRTCDLDRAERRGPRPQQRARKRARQVAAAACAAGHEE